MSEFEQANVRIPPAARDTLVRLAKLLREDRNFLARLRRFLEEDQQPGMGAFLSSRIDRMEAEFNDLRAQLATGNVTLSVTTGGDGEVRVVGVTGVPGADPSRSETWTVPTTATWTVGEGKGRRLSEAGREELDRLLSTDATDIEIAKKLGIKTYAITRRRKNETAQIEAEEEEHGT